jgi:hypothetical protein
MCSIEQIRLGIKTTVNPVFMEVFPMNTHSPDRDWISIAEQVSVEKDTAKLAILLERLCCALDDRRNAALPLAGRTNR